MSERTRRERVGWRVPAIVVIAFCLYVVSVYGMARTRLPLGLAWPLGAALVLPAVMWAMLDRRTSGRSRRAMMGLCVRCGYDLRATPNRCPECGLGR